MELIKLIEETDNFFQLHWNRMKISMEPPKWSIPWQFSGSIANGDMAGCYALFSNEKLLYIGVAERGLGSRTNSYTRVLKTQSSIQERSYVAEASWQARDLTHLHTIAFPVEYWYLSAALEKFLIRKLNPSENRNGK